MCFGHSFTHPPNYPPRDWCLTTPSGCGPVACCKCTKTRISACFDCTCLISDPCGGRFQSPKHPAFGSPFFSHPHLPAPPVTTRSTTLDKVNQSVCQRTKSDGKGGGAKSGCGLSIMTNMLITTFNTPDPLVPPFPTRVFLKMINSSSYI